MIEEKDILKFKNIDFDYLLKVNVANIIEKSSNHIVKEELKECFESIKILYSYIIGYDFSEKPEIEGIIEILNPVIMNNEGEKIKFKSEIKLKNDKKVQIREFIDRLWILVIGGYVQLGLWFKTTKVKSDWDSQLSENTFKEESTNLNEEIKILGELTTEEILKLMTSNDIHKIYSYKLFKDASEEVKIVTS